MALGGRTPETRSTMSGELGGRRADKCGCGDLSNTTLKTTLTDIPSGCSSVHSPRTAPYWPPPAATEPYAYGTYNPVNAIAHSASLAPSTEWIGTRPEPSCAPPAEPAPTCSPIYHKAQPLVPPLDRAPLLRDKPAGPASLSYPLMQVNDQSTAPTRQTDPAHQQKSRNPHTPARADQARPTLRSAVPSGLHPHATCYAHPTAQSQSSTSNTPATTSA